MLETYNNNIDIKIQKAFMYSFSLHQNATTIEEFEKYLENIYILFNSKHTDLNYSLALANLRKYVNNRKSIHNMSIRNAFNKSSHYSSKTSIFEKNKHMIKRKKPLWISLILKC